MYVNVFGVVMRTTTKLEQMEPLESEQNYRLERVQGSHYSSRDDRSGVHRPHPLLWRENEERGVACRHEDID